MGHAQHCILPQTLAGCLQSCSLQRKFKMQPVIPLGEKLIIASALGLISNGGLNHFSTSICFPYSPFSCLPKTLNCRFPKRHMERQGLRKFSSQSCAFQTICISEEMYIYFPLTNLKNEIQSFKPWDEPMWVPTNVTPQKERASRNLI